MLDTSLVFCTLLGPEGPGRLPSEVDRTSGPQAFGPRSSDLVVTGSSSWHGRYRPYFENYTVDASILDLHSNVRIT